MTTDDSRQAQGEGVAAAAPVWTHNALGIPTGRRWEWDEVGQDFYQGWETGHPNNLSPELMAAHVNALEERAADGQRWREAIEDAGINNWTLSEQNANDPRRAVADLLAFVNMVALDPAVSEQAAELHRRAAAGDAAVVREHVLSVFSRNFEWGLDGRTLPQALAEELADLKANERQQTDLHMEQRARAEAAERQLQEARDQRDHNWELRRQEANLLAASEHREAVLRRALEEISNWGSYEDARTAQRALDATAAQQEEAE